MSSRLDPYQQEAASKLTGDDVDLLNHAGTQVGLVIASAAPLLRRMIEAGFVTIEPMTNGRAIAHLTEDGFAAIAYWRQQTSCNL